MKRSILKRVLCLTAILALALQLFGCAAEGPGSGQTPTEPAVKAVNLMAEITPASAQAAPMSKEGSEAAADFALRLFRASHREGENTLLSPLSVLSALSMTANGAEGATLTQMESTLGMRRDLWNECFRSWLNALSGDPALKQANSVWFTSDPRFTVNRDFLQTNADYYGADVYQAPFDGTTLADLNNWVKEKTDGMIPRILDEIPPEAVMYLVNALAFDARWAKQYEKYSVWPGEFTCADGTKRTVDFMWSEESQYLEGERFTGFIKPYEGGKYAFAALLPKEGCSVEDCLEGLDGASLQALLASPQQEMVNAGLPKFESETSLELSEVLKSMGMELPFDGGLADLSGLGTSTGGNIYISRVLHKTFITVSEDGTRAGAATVVEACDESAMEMQNVILDRPFIYMLIDTETNLPFFIGTLQNPAS